MAELSIADLTEDADENKMEITRNPFDSQLYDKDNFPGLDASVFMKSTTPEREKDGFRWSISQIALMNPAELDLNPNQEYSVSYDRKEDEIRDQEEVNQYFQNVLLPSPWLDDNGEVLKRVTFSPHPPSMRYIHDNNSSDSCDGSIERIEKESIERNEQENVQKETTMSDACCQTKITFPINFDLEALLEKQFCSYAEVSGEGKELMVSTLRRKLFEQENNDLLSQYRVTSSPRKTAVSSADNSPRSILDSPSISPVKRVSPRSILDSPSISPVKRVSSGSSSSSSVFSRSCDFRSKCASNVGSPDFVRNIEMSLSSVDVSPIGSCEKKYDDQDNCSFMPEVSFDVNESDGVKESSRAIQFGSPDVSPIQNIKKSNSMLGSSTVMDSMEIRETGIQSIKESTACNTHAFSGFDISSIGNVMLGKDGEDKLECSSALAYHGKRAKQESSGNVTEDKDFLLIDDIILEDDGPLDITELTTDGDESNCTYSCTTDESVNKNEGTSSDAESVGSVRKLNVNTPETVVNNAVVAGKINDTEAPKINDADTLVITKTLEKNTSESTSPLKGILKNSDSVTPTQPLSNSTRYNTLCNSGKKRPIPKFSPDVDTPSGKCNRAPKTSLINRSLSDEFNLESDISLHFKCDKIKTIDHLTTHDGLIAMRANSVLRRATNVVKRCERENIGKENKSPTPTSPGNNCKSEEDNGNARLSCDDLKKSELLHSDAYVDTMEWCSEVRKNETKKVSPCTSGTGITPLMRLTNKLNITDRTPWSARKVLCDSGKYSYTSSRYSSARPHTWVNKCRSAVTTPVCTVPRSRVTASRCRSEMTYLKQIQSDYQYGHGSVLSAYKDLLPSPLK